MVACAAGLWIALAVARSFLETKVCIPTNGLLRRGANIIAAIPVFDIRKQSLQQPGRFVGSSEFA